MVADFELRWARGGFDSINISTDASTGNHEFLRSLVHEKIREAVEDPSLHDVMTPNYPYGCKRSVIADGFYETLNQPNVTLVPLNGSSVDGFTTNGLTYSGGTFIFWQPRSQKQNIRGGAVWLIERNFRIYETFLLLGAIMHPPMT